jgi:hypothetical protein
MHKSRTARSCLFVAATSVLLSTATSGRSQAQGWRNPVIWDRVRQTAGITFSPFTPRQKTGGASLPKLTSGSYAIKSVESSSHFSHQNRDLVVRFSSDGSLHQYVLVRFPRHDDSSTAVSPRKRLAWRFLL